MRFREGLIEAMPHIHKWIAEGGHLLTLYHRPWDQWDPTACRRNGWRSGSRACAGG